MNAGLLRALRDRMTSQSDQELLRLWVENDRGTYSDESFEAARLLLSEREIDLPPQNDPPPVAAAAPAPSFSTPADPASVSYFEALFRPVLWIGAVVGVTNLLAATGLAVEYMDLFLLRRPSIPMSWSGWQAPTLVAETALAAGRPAVLLLGVWAAMHRWRRSRRLLLIYVWVAFATAGLRLVFAVYALHVFDYRNEWASELRRLDDLLNPAVYPLVLLVFLTRPQAGELIGGESAGFEVRPAGPGDPKPVEG